MIPLEGLLTRDVMEHRGRRPADRVTAYEGSKPGDIDNGKNRIMLGISEQLQTRLDGCACTNIPKETGVGE